MDLTVKCKKTNSGSFPRYRVYRGYLRQKPEGGNKAGGLSTLPFPLSLPSPFPFPLSFQTNQWEGRSDPVRGEFPASPLQIPPCAYSVSLPECMNQGRSVRLAKPKPAPRSTRNTPHFIAADSVATGLLSVGPLRLTGNGHEPWASCVCVRRACVWSSSLING